MQKVIAALAMLATLAFLVTTAWSVTATGYLEPARLDADHFEAGAEEP